MFHSQWICCSGSVLYFKVSFISYNILDSQSWMTRVKFLGYTLNITLNKTTHVFSPECSKHFTILLCLIQCCSAYCNNVALPIASVLLCLLHQRCSAYCISVALPITLEWSWGIENFFCFSQMFNIVHLACLVSENLFHSRMPGDDKAMLLSTCYSIVQWN